MRIALNDFVLVYVQVVLSSRYFMTIRSSSSAVCVRSSFVPALLGRTQLAGDAVIFAIHVRVSSNCAYIYRSRWGRATCLSNWAQGLNMERLRARAPGEAIPKPREPYVRQQGGGARVVCDPGH